VNDTGFERHVVVPASGVIDGFKLRELISGGGHTSYVRVTDMAGRSYAMQILNREYIGDTRLRARFAREVNLLLRLSGPAFPMLRSHGVYTVGPMRTYRMW